MNIAVEYRWTDNERLPATVADMVRRQVSAIVTGGLPASLAGKAVTTAIPIVFATGGDPVHLGLVASLNRPGGNVTGVSFLLTALIPKQLELLHQLVPTATAIAFLVPKSGSGSGRLWQQFLEHLRVSAMSVREQET